MLHLGDQWNLLAEKDRRQTVRWVFLPSSWFWTPGGSCVASGDLGFGVRVDCWAAGSHKSGSMAID